MRYALVLSMVFLIVLTGCTSIPEELPDHPVVVDSVRETAAPEITVQEKSSIPKPVRVEETTITAGKPELESYRIEDDILLFTNIDGETYRAPLSRLRYQEGSTRANYTIQRGDYVVVLSDGVARILRYISTEAGKKKVVFLDGETTIETYYLPVQAQIRELIGRSHGQRPRSGVSTSAEDLITLNFDEVRQLNPTVSFDEYADTQTIGIGELSIAGRDYRYYIGYSAGSPLSLDLDGDGEIKGKKMPLLTKSGETVLLWKR
ncbi:hypothetical protein HY641_00395 [Candidatus Woesearchaeota archaeon]|nr:hypothetical protein [Candidatus Woesearchaeota archaeon]